MDESTRKYTRRRKGQTLAEFGLTLPFLLVLVFGIIESGRLFQAWVTLQNSAREATRYATTGGYNEDRYQLLTETDYRNDDLDNPLDQAVLDVDLVPCVQNEDLRGTPQILVPNPAEPTHQITYYTGGAESLYATWYDGEDCDPTIPAHQDRRRDIARIVSIIDEARRAAAGISLEANQLGIALENNTGAISDAVREYLMESVWSVPLPRNDDPSWFNVMMCSTRANYNDLSTSLVPENPPRRYITVLDETEGGVPAEVIDRYQEPFCMLNEIPPPDTNAPINAGARWLDPGAPGDRVTVVVTFNHPLITPVRGLSNYVHMEARRSGINESFRQPRALSVQPAGPPAGAEADTATPMEPTDTPTRTPTRTPPQAPTSTPTSTLTPTPGPFECQAIRVSNLQFFGQYVYMDIENLNFLTTELERIDLRWRVRPETGFPNRYLGSMGVNGEVFWAGQENSGQLDTGGFTQGSNDYELFVNSDRRIPGLGQVTSWEGIFLNAGGQLGSVFNVWDFGGTTLYFTNFDVEGNPVGSPCPITLELPEEPEQEDEVPPADATDTYTPDCASSQVRVEWGGFDSFGVVRLRVINDRPNTTADLTDFNVAWPTPASLGLADGILTLDKIAAGGNNPDDPQASTIWVGNDRNPNTRPNEGTFTTFSFPPNSRTNLYLDFGGTGSTLRDAFGIHPSMFNGTQFEIGCGTFGGGGNGGPGGNPAGDIFLSTVEPPQPTNTPRPSNTPGPSRTPSPTRPTNTPSNTWTPGPTQTPSNTPTNTVTPTPTVRSIATQPPSGGGDG